MGHPVLSRVSDPDEKYCRVGLTSAQGQNQIQPNPGLKTDPPPLYLSVPLTDDHPDWEPGEGEGVEAEHQVDVDEDAEDGHQWHTGHVETRRTGLREPKGRGRAAT